MTHEIAVEKLHSDYKYNITEGRNQVDELKLSLKHMQSEKNQLKHDMQR